VAYHLFAYETDKENWMLKEESRLEEISIRQKAKYGGRKPHKDF